MAKAYKCDRCGNYYDPQSYIDDKFVICKSNLVKADICPICRAEFGAWFEERKTFKEAEDGTKG